MHLWGGVKWRLVGQVYRVCVQVWDMLGITSNRGSYRPITSPRHVSETLGGIVNEAFGPIKVVVLPLLALLKWHEYRPRKAPKSDVIVCSGWSVDGL